MCSSMLSCVSWQVAKHIVARQRAELRHITLDNPGSPPLQILLRTEESSLQRTWRGGGKPQVLQNEPPGSEKEGVLLSNLQASAVVS